MLIYDDDGYDDDDDVGVGVDGPNQYQYKRINIEQLLTQNVSSIV